MLVALMLRAPAAVQRARGGRPAAAAIYTTCLARCPRMRWHMLMPYFMVELPVLVHRVLGWVRGGEGWYQARQKHQPSPAHAPGHTPPLAAALH